MIYIVVPVFNRWKFTEACLKSLDLQTNKDFKVVVVDHGSTDGTENLIKKEFPDVTVLIGDESMWWTAATNLGVEFALEKADADFILSLNNDLVVPTDYVQKLYDSSIAKPDAIIGSVSVDIDEPEKVVFAGTKWNNLLARYSRAADIRKPYSLLKSEIDFVRSDVLPGRGTLIPVAVFKKIGLYNQKDFPHYMADEDLVLRARKTGIEAYISTKVRVLSHVKETRLKKVYKGFKKIGYLRDTFSSIRSPNRISTRWYWAMHHGKIPVLYFTLDFGRVFISQVLKSIKD